MKPGEVDLEPRLRDLWADLRDLRSALQAETRRRWGRVNPLTEDLIDWKQKGELVAGPGKDVTIYESTTVAGDVEIGDHTWVGPFCSLDGTGGLRIGRYCSISAGTHIQSHDTVSWALSGGRQPPSHRPVRIGDQCFIGVNAVITAGVTIGDRCLVAAGAVVTHDVPPGTVVAGVPARAIGTVEVSADGSVEIRYD